MENYQREQGSIIYKAGDPFTEFGIIMKGSVRIVSKLKNSISSSGSIIGLTSIASGSYTCDFIAEEDVTIRPYPYKSYMDLKSLLDGKPEISATMVSNMVLFLLELSAEYLNLHKKCTLLGKIIEAEYNDYKTLCNKLSVSIKSLPQLEQLEPLQLEDALDMRVFEYYKALHTMPAGVKKPFYAHNTHICIEELYRTAAYIDQLYELGDIMSDYLSETAEILLNNKKLDFFNLFAELLYKAMESGQEVPQITEKLETLTKNIKVIGFIDPELLSRRLEEHNDTLSNFTGQVQPEKMKQNEEIQEELKDSLNRILEYAPVEQAKKEAFCAALNKYKKMTDKSATGTDDRALRKELGKLFYDMYEAIFFNTLHDHSLPTILKMFFYFGYMDEELTGMENAVKLYNLASHYRPDPNQRVFPFYDWLKLIDAGKREPSKNAFDMDYAAHLREQKKNKAITDKQEAELLANQTEKVKFELHNLFVTANQVTYGRISDFCPVLSEHNIIRNLSDILVTPAIVDEKIAQITALDYSAFYREVSYHDEKAGINQMFIEQETLPEVILMPNIGSRGLMWQEYYGNYRNSPARMMVSIFCVENLEDLFIRLVGEFRWELCRRLQGPRWNDITDRSLTSEYADYIQFYRKNHDLSAEAKEKVKLALQKSKNSFREMFVRDYLIWLKFESNGSSRLNKVSRTILFTYCPFRDELRKKHATTPMFKEIIEKYSIKKTQKMRSVDLQFFKIKKDGGQITPTLEEYYNYLLM